MNSQLKLSESVSGITATKRVSLTAYSNISLVSRPFKQALEQGYSHMHMFQQFGHWYHLRLPNLSASVSVVLLTYTTFEYLVHVIFHVDKLRERYNFTQKWPCMRKQSIPGHFSPPTHHEYESKGNDK